MNKVNSGVGFSSIQKNINTRKGSRFGVGSEFGVVGGRRENNGFNDGVLFGTVRSACFNNIIGNVGFDLVVS